MEEDDDEGEEDAHPDIARRAGVIATRSRFFLTWMAMTPFYRWEAILSSVFVCTHKSNIQRISNPSNIATMQG